MNRPARTHSRRTRQGGVGMIEVMVGILIGMIVIVVIYNILSLAEGYRRATVGASDAQITGLLSQFVAGRDAGNGGSSITISNSDMINCIKNEGGFLVSVLPVTSLDAAIRPLPVLITDGGVAPEASDSFISYFGGAAHVTWPVSFTAPSAAAAPITVQSPNGFTVPPPTVTPYWAVAMTNDGTGRCKLLRVTDAVLDVTLPLTGKVTLTQDPLFPTTINYPVSSRLLNLGPERLATRVRYDLDSVNGILRTTDLLVVPPALPTAVPIAQNIVFMKVQYGIDDNLDGVVDCWTFAKTVACGDYSEATVRAAPLTSPVANATALNKILAIRIGIVVRSEEPDLRLLTDPGNLVLQDEARSLQFGSRPQVFLFNCSANTNAACQGRVPVPMGAGVPVGSPTCAGAVICDFWRYRTYETIIPLRNTIYSASMTP